MKKKNISERESLILVFMSTDCFYTMFISAIAILVGYLIPGYLLRTHYYQKTKTALPVDCV